MPASSRCPSQRACFRPLPPCPCVASSKVLWMSLPRPWPPAPPPPSHLLKPDALCKRVGLGLAPGGPRLQSDLTAALPTHSSQLDLAPPGERLRCPPCLGLWSQEVLRGECLRVGPRRSLGVSLLTWGLRGARLQIAGLSANRLHQRVAAPDDVGALVALHVAHPHAHPARLGALSGERRGDHGPPAVQGAQPGETWDSPPLARLLSLRGRGTHGRSGARQPGDAAATTTTTAAYYSASQ